LYPPLSALEVTVAMLCGGITRGLVVGFFSVMVSIIFIHVPIHSLIFILIYGILGSSLLASLGFLAGLWSEKFDNMAAVTNSFVPTFVRTRSDSSYVVWRNYQRFGGRFFFGYGFYYFYSRSYS